MHAHMHNTYFLQGLATHFLSTINTYSSAKSIKEPLRKLQNCHAWWDLTNKNQSTHLRSVWTQGTPKSKSLSSVSPSNLPCGGWIHHFRILYHIVGTKIYHYNIPTIVAFIVILPHKITSGHLPWEILRDIPIISPFPRQILRKLLRVRVLVKAG